MKKTFIILVFILLGLVAAFFVFRIWTKSHSPQTTVTFQTNDLKIKIVYSQPKKKGREIFGGLVPFGKVWRTGANEATLITFDQDVLIGGKSLSAGEYSLWTIPNPTEWTIIFNKETGQWGTNYNESKDILHINVTPNKQDIITEDFTINLTPKPSGALLNLSWDQTHVAVPIRLQ